MRAARVQHAGRVHAAVVEGSLVRLVPDAEGEPVALIARGGWPALDRAATDEVAAEDVQLLAPVGRPGKILGIGLNYRDHADEQDVSAPSVPVVFAMFASAVSGPGEPIPLHPITDRTDYEAELAVVISTPARRVPAERALDHVAGFTILNDVTAWDLQAADVQWIRGKALDGYAPMGPVLVSPDEFGPVGGHAIRCRVNGQLRQDADTGNLLHDLPALIAHITEAVTLEPGDVIATGTPSGVGHFMSPPRYLQAGDVVSIQIEGIGELTNPVAAVDRDEG